jgi:hypothetical protein
MKRGKAPHAGLSFPASGPASGAEKKDEPVSNRYILPLNFFE